MNSVSIILVVTAARPSAPPMYSNRPTGQPHQQLSHQQQQYPPQHPPPRPPTMGMNQAVRFTVFPSLFPPRTKDQRTKVVLKWDWMLLLAWKKLVLIHQR